MVEWINASSFRISGDDYKRFMEEAKKSSEENPNSVASQIKRMLAEKSEDLQTNDDV